MTAKTTAAGTIVCVGAGPIGVAWSSLFASHGYPTALVDVDQSRLDSVRDEPGLASVQLARDLGDVLDEAVFLFEAIAEDAEVKTRFCADLDARLPEQCTFASSSSGIPVSRFAPASLQRRALIAHPLNPPSIVPVVEICPSPATDPSRVAAVSELLTACGRRPVLVRREITGFVANRLALALYREAAHLVGNGTISAADLDALVREGLGKRWAVAGPSETYQLNQRDTMAAYFARIDEHLREIVAALDAGPALDAAGTDAMCRWRDELLSPVELPARLRERDEALSALYELLDSRP